MKNKKIIFAVAAVIFVFLIYSAHDLIMVNNLSDKLIRFHVIANSDSPKDQELKLHVRDAVLSQIGPILEKSKSKEESEQIIKQNIGLIKTVAEDEIKKYGENYGASVVFGKYSFPVKMYSTIALPSGEYDALKIIIGEGNGKNWWCVMFPPLCFIDITKGITSGETEERLKTVLDTAEYNSILNNDSNIVKGAVKKPIEGDITDNLKDIAKKPQKIELRLKSVETAHWLYKKFEKIFSKDNEVIQ